MKFCGCRRPESTSGPGTPLGVGAASLLGWARGRVWALDVYKLQAVVDALVDVSLRLALEAFNDGLLLIKLRPVN